MAKKKRRGDSSAVAPNVSTQSNGKTSEQYNKSLGYSDKALKALGAGKYDELTGRNPKYNRSQSQKVATQPIPALKGINPLGGQRKSSEISSKNSTNERKNRIDTTRARQKYAQRQEESKESAQDVLNKMEQKQLTPVLTGNLKDPLNKKGGKTSSPVMSSNQKKISTAIKKISETAPKATGVASTRRAKEELGTGSVDSRKSTGKTAKSARQKYEEYIGHTPTKGLSQEDADFLYKVFDRNRTSSGGKDAIIHQLKNNIWHNTNDWEEKYGKTVEQIVDEYAADFDKKSERKDWEYGKEHGKLATLKNVVTGGTAQPAIDLESTILGKVAPNSAYTQAVRNATENYAKKKKQTKEGVTSTMGSIGKGTYDFLTDLAERGIEYASPSELKYLLQFGKSSEAARQSLKERGIEGTGAEYQSAATGAVDAVLDAIGLESFPAIKKAIKSGKIGKEVIARLIAGGGEQGITYAINEAIDRLNGDKSRHNIALNNYLAQGMTQKQAEDAVSADEFWEGVKQVASGAALNNVIGLGGKAAGKAVNSVVDALTGRNIPSLWTPTGRAETPQNSQIPVEKMSNLEEAIVREQQAANEMNLLRQAMDAQKLQPELGKVGENPETPVNRAFASTASAENLQTPVEKPGNVIENNGIIEDVLPDVNTRRYSDAEMAEINDYANRRDAIRSEMDKNVNIFDLASMTKLNDMSNEIKGMDAEMAEKYPELFDYRGKFTGVPDNDVVDNLTDMRYNDVATDENGFVPDYQGVEIEYNDKYVEPEMLTHALTGKQVSPEYAAFVRKLESGQVQNIKDLSAEYNAIPEVAQAKAKAGTGSTNEIQTPERIMKRGEILDDINKFGSAEEYIDPATGKKKVRYTGQVDRGHRADIIIGLPSSGKSSAVVDPISNKYKSKLLDSDEVKKLIPEFDDGWGAGLVHEESKDILAYAKAAAFKNGENVVLPVVGSNVKKIRDEIKLLRDVYGYDVHLHLNDLDSAKAAARNMRRFASQGRFVDLDSTSFDYGDKPREVYEQLKKEGVANGYTKVSNDVRIGENPVQTEGTEVIPFDWRNNGQSGRTGVADITSGSGKISSTEGVGTGYDRAGSKGIPGESNAGRPRIEENSGVESEQRGQLSADSVNRAGQLKGNEAAFTDDEIASLRNNGIDTPNFYKANNDPELYVDALETAKASNVNGAAVDSHTVKQMQDIVNNGGNMYLVDDGMSGYAVEGDGNLTAVFKNSNSDAPAMGSKIALASIKNGAVKGDCFGKTLVDIYSRGGYEPVARMEYGRGFNPDMDAQVDRQLAEGKITKEPDVYAFKKRDDFDYDRTVAEWNDPRVYTQEELDALPKFDDYDEMLAYRDSLLGGGEITRTDVNNAPVNRVESTPTDVNNNPPRVLDLTQEANGDVKERGTSEHIRSQEDVRVATPMKYKDLADEVVADFIDDPDMYKQLRNKDTLALSDAIYDAGDAPVRINGKIYEGNAEAKFRSLLAEKNPASLPLGTRIAKDYSNQGNHQMAAQMYRDMGQALTDAGQFTQASVISMMKNDPLTALAYMEKELDALNKNGAEKYGKKWKNFELTDEERAQFDKIDPGDTDAIRAAYDKVGERIERDYPVTMWEKVLEFRRVAMLFNTRTIIRNTLANPPTAIMRYMSDRIEGVGQAFANLKNPEIERTQSITGSTPKYRKAAVQVYNSDKVQRLLKEVPGKLSEVPKVGDYAKTRQVFKGGVLSDLINKCTNNGIEKLNAKLGKKNAKSILELGRNAAYGALEITDSPMVRENFVSRLGSYMKVKGITDPDKVPDEGIQIALEEALKATYKDNSWLVQAIKNAKKTVENVGNNIVPGVRAGDMASQALIPYVQAPGNIGARIVDYSPAGAIKGITRIIGGASNSDPKLIRQGIEEFSKGATGTLMAGLGMALYKSGILTGTYSNDSDQAAWEKQHGFREFAIRWQDKNGKTHYDTIDWAQPFVDTLMPGVLLQQAIDNSDEYDSDILRYFGVEGSKLGQGIGIAKDATGKNINYFFSATPLKNFGELFKGGYNGETDIAGNLWENTVEDFATALSPAALNAAAKSIDPIQRQTYDPDNEFASFINSNMARIPEVSKNLPIRYNTWGDAMTYGDSQGEAAFGKMIYPGEHTTDNSDALDTEINRLFTETNNKDVFPRVSPNKIDGVALTAQEKSQHQNEMGQMSRELAQTFIDSDLYKNMSDVDRAQAIQDMFSFTMALENNAIKGKELSKANQSLLDIYKESGSEGLVSAIAEKRYNAALKDAGVSTSGDAAKGIKDALKSGDQAKANQLISQEKANQAAKEVEKEEAREAGYVKSNGAVDTTSYEKAIKKAGNQGEKFKNDLPILNELQVEKPAYYVYANAVQKHPDIDPNEFVQTYNEINTNKGDKLTQKEMLAYLNEWQFSDNPEEDAAIAKDIWNTYNDGSWKKVPYLVDGVWKAK